LQKLKPEVEILQLGVEFDEYLSNKKILK